MMTTWRDVRIDEGDVHVRAERFAAIKPSHGVRSRPVVRDLSERFPMAA